MDLEGDGVNFIPLEESEAYFDVDDDGEKEHTAWIEKGDAFLTTHTLFEEKLLRDIERRKTLFVLGGFNELLISDVDKDNDYDQIDVEQLSNDRARDLIFGGFVKDFDPEGNFARSHPLYNICPNNVSIVRDNTNKSSPMSSVQIWAKGRLICGKKEFKLYEIRFAYSETSDTD
jgi:hypothetical protein